ncbi:penicillin-binding protein [bacterium]|nr:penicillin-binding protein [bacterium]
MTKKTSKSIIRLDHPANRKKTEPKSILKSAKRILTLKNIGKFFMYSFFGALSFLLLLFAWFAKDLPSPDKINSRILSESTQILDRNGNLIYEIHGDKNRIVLEFKDLPENLRNATVAVEDKEFYKHKGFSITGMGRAFTGVIFRDKSKGGGSTITQQYVKNALLTSERTFSRKIKEIILATEIEMVYSKDDILRMYLNEIPYGSNAYGAEAAAKMYFGKSAKDLTLEECATLAAIVQKPTYFSPYGSHVDELLARKDMVLTRMKDQGFITEEKMLEAQKTEIAFSKKREDITYPHFVMYVKEKLVEKYGEKMVEEGGLKVTTTLDPDKQKLAEQVVSEEAPPQLKKNGATNASLVAQDPKTGQILAMVGSLDYWNEEIDGNVNVAIRDRQPGSSFKPFEYATAWKKDGYGPGTPIFDLRTDFGGNPPYKPENYDGREHGIQTMRNSLAQSLNIPAVKTLYIAGIKETIDTAHDMGITTLNEPDRYGLALALGGGEVKLVDMVAAYSVFANQGERAEQTAILKVTDSKGKILEEYKDAKQKQVLDPQIAYLISDVLSDDAARAPIFGRGSALTLKNRPVAAKTGTTQQYRDAWTMGYTPSLTTGVWVGNNDNTPLKSGAGGAMAAAPIWNKFMARALEGTKVEEFEKPKGIKDITLDKVTGKKPVEGSETVSDKFPSWYKVASTSAKNYKVYTVDGLLATDNCNPEATKTVYGASVSAEIPPEDGAYSRWMKPIAAWAASHGYSTKLVPNEYTKLCDPENQPKITIELSDTEINSGESVTVTANVTTPLGAKKVDFYVDDKLKATDTSEPYTKSVVLTGSGSKKITVKVTDEGLNTASDSSSVLVKGTSTDPNMNLSISGNLAWKMIFKQCEQNLYAIRRLVLPHSLAPLKFRIESIDRSDGYLLCINLIES